MNSRIKQCFLLVLVSLLAFGFTSCGPSAAEIAIRSAPSVEAVKGLKDKLIWLQGNAQSGGNYVIEIDTDSKEVYCLLSECTQLSYNLSYKDKSNITITIRGIGANRTIYSSFTVESGVTLILDDNITIQGKTEERALVKVLSGGTLVMNEGSTITGATNNKNNPQKNTEVYGAGVYVDYEGTFIMKGGTIYGNTIRPRTLTVLEARMGAESAALTAVQGVALKSKAGLYKGNENIEDKARRSAEKAIDEVFTIKAGGVGVYVSHEEFGLSLFSDKIIPSGTFIKTGGTITGYSSDPENGNVIMDIDGNVINGYGHAVLFAGFRGREPKAIDITIGPEYSFHFSNGTFSEGRKEEPEPQKTIAATEKTTIPSNDCQTGVISGPSLSYGGEIYGSVVICGQTWLNRNLNYNTDGSVCYANCATYGRLYNWSTAMALPSNCNSSSCSSQISAKHKGICPSGWHIPSNAEWDKLMHSVDGTSGTSSPYDSPTAGRYLKSTSGWNNNGNGQDTYGFSALPGGLGYSDGDFYDVGYNGFWWSASEFNSNYAYTRRMYYDFEDAYWYSGDKSHLFSVRCVQD